MTISTLLIVSLLSIIFSWLMVRFLIVYLGKRNIVDTPNERTMHEGAVPRGGGLAIVVGLLLALLGVAFHSDRAVFFLSIAALVLFWAGLSWWDDKTDLSPKLRFVLHIAISITTVLGFGWLVDIQISENIWITVSWLGLPLTCIGVLWTANLTNFMDGIDGLAAAQIIIASVTFSFWFWQAGDAQLALVCAVLAGLTYGFLLWNWQPAKIFMGDVGSISIGALFATLIIIGVTRYQFSVISCAILLAVFVSDASLTLLRRIWRKEPFWLPHRSHYYQRLAALGIDHGRIVIAAIVLMLLCSCLATAALVYRDIILPALLVALIVIGAAFGVVIALEKRHFRI